MAWFRFYFNRRIVVGLLLALIILSWLAVSSYWNTQHLIKSGSMVAHTLDVLYHAERVLAITTNIELGQRGYLLTGKDDFLEPYTKALNEIDFHLNKLSDLTQDNPIQHQRIIKLHATIRELLRFSTNAVVESRENFQRTESANATLHGKQLMDLIRGQIKEIENAENRLLSVRTVENEKWIKKFNAGFISLLFVTGIILAGIFVAINHSLKKKVEAERKLTRAYAEVHDLYDKAPCGYHSLDDSGKIVEINQTLLKWLGYDKSEVVNKMNIVQLLSVNDIPVFQKMFAQFKAVGFVSNLELSFVKKSGAELPVLLNAVAVKDKNGKFIKSRSTTFDNTERKQAAERIQNLNKELEAFTYSVSHDLRAPLRSIDGYSRILQEDYGLSLDDEGKRLLHVVRNNARRMGKLIDDLLDFARLGRKDVMRSTVNMTQLVNSIAKELMDQEQRKINIRVNPLKPSYGDPDMMRQVWENLLSNAIKYTGKTENPSIEVSSSERDHEVCYKIEDNGVGFDMQYAPKLFGVFQRLHRMQDFSGTGVGLAIVKRIVERHQGKVWAEGAINNGATFYFTIPNGNGT